jgi:hypothetical protein
MDIRENIDSRDGILYADQKNRGGLGIEVLDIKTRFFFINGYSSS